MKAQVLPAMTASVISTKPTAMNLGDQVVQRAQRGQPVVEFAGFFGLEFALLEEIGMAATAVNDQCRIPEQDENDVDGDQPDAADDGLIQALRVSPGWRPATSRRPAER